MLQRPCLEGDFVSKELGNSGRRFTVVAPRSQLVFDGAGVRASVEMAIGVIAWMLHNQERIAMAWERRAGQCYYYSATRRGGRVEKTYHGKDVFGELAAGVIADTIRRRAERVQALAAEKCQLAPVERAMAALDDACGLMFEATLNVEGYRKNSGHWRRRRVRLEDRRMVQATRRGRDPGPA
jgi:hypothetical protein